MRRVCLFGYPPIENFHGYKLETIDPLPFFPRFKHSSLHDLLSGGWNDYLDRKKLCFAHGLDKLYRNRDPGYMLFSREFVNRFHDFDIVVLGQFCPIHPEILFNELKKPIKILGFIDDPGSTYVRGVPYLWAFDGAFYVSPSYNEQYLFSEKMEQWGCRNNVWWPLVPHRFDDFTPSKTFFSQRTIDLTYVGFAYSPKIDRLIKLKKVYGSRFRLHGYWGLNGFQGIARGLLGKKVLWHRVTPLSMEQRKNLYLETKIGFNMHLSDVPRETGNMRMYEAPAHGMMLLCDKAGRNAHERIFLPNREAIYYDSIDEAIALIDYYLAHDSERIEIAKAGFERFRRDYDWEGNLLRFLDWAWSLREERERATGTS